MKKIFCPECGPAEVPHFLAKSNLTISLISESLTKPLTPAVNLLSRLLARPLQFFGYYFLIFLAGLRMVKLLSQPSMEKDTDRAKCMWQAAAEKGVKVREVWAAGHPINIFLAKLPSGKKMVFEGLPRPGHGSDALLWMDDKGKMKKFFRKAGFPVPRGKTCFSLWGARRVFNQIRKNGNMVVVKPTLGSRSRHTRVHLKTLAELGEAFRIAKQICPIVSVEEELLGTVYRVVLIGGKLAGVLRRDPPLVTGDGQMSVRELVALANRDPRRHGPTFHEIPMNAELDAALRVEKMNRESVTRLGQKVIVGTKVGRSQGGTNVDVTDEIHIENRKLFLDIAKFLQDPLVGIDFIIEDIRRPWRAQMPCGVIELNSIPFLDLHMYPFEGRARDLSRMLWEEVLQS